MRMKIQEATPLTGLHEGTCSSAAKAASTHERLLVAQAKSGRSSAFGKLFELHRVRIYHTAFRILRNRQDAEDAVQRSFQRAFTNLYRFREDSTFSTWITRIAINDALMLLRQRRASKRLSENNDDTERSSALDLTDKAPTPEQALAENELRADVIHAISLLGENLRIVVLLRELQGLTSAETARRLCLTVSAVKARTFRARRYLRKYLEPQYGAAGGGFRQNAEYPTQSIPRHLACAETWAGNDPTASLIELPGLTAWVHSVPADLSHAGGDVHYVSVCPSCVVSRIALADVSGHGQAVALFGKKLRELMQRYLSFIEQTALMQDLNQAVRQEFGEGHYATMVAIGWHGARGLVTMTSAGHPPPLWYRAARDEWSWLQTRLASEPGRPAGVPLGLLADVSYDQLVIKPQRGDLIVLYSDGVSEAMNPAGNELGL